MPACTPTELEDAVRTVSDVLFDRGWERGKEHGLERGMEQGIEQGMERGIKQSSLRMARAMLQRSMRETDILEITGLTVEQLDELKEKQEET